MVKLRPSRRVAGLKESDYDHAIDLVDHDSPPASPRSVSNGASDSGGPSPRRSGERQPSRAESSGKGKQAEPVVRRTSTDAADGTPPPGQEPRGGGPSIEIQGEEEPAKRQLPEPTPHVEREPSTRNSLGNVSTAAAEHEPVFDLLYENERGGFLCGVALFSSLALGNLDPAAWTNAYHKASPTDTRTAQVPDPTWEWAWPEWRVHHHDDVDEGGWEYSFMFSRKFSWHGPQWWNSFVRRRIWIRKRVKRKLTMTASRGAHQQMLNADYFSVRPASERSRSRSVTQAGTSRAGSRASAASAASDAETAFSELKERIGDVESLLYVLRRARIDREKVEAVGTYLEQGTDLENLQGRMHDVMRIFIFQTSRTMLLKDLTRLLDETTRELEEKGGGPELEGRRAHLEGAARCADEEVRRLAYWSDIKGMVEGGESAMAVAEGWGGEWEGVDQSGPAPPRKESGS